ncbi:hypothetical protein B8W66_05705 [Mycobacterium decipiens]|uniref:THIF-type NAD/FAD binding fold domain-containing protein n=1 Tax=Mycobacterium decipiens TaxID=1430326 RepID=A0A1X2LXT6_9MYCO|nr:hypothetical protein B8W66_05705 [Mycobacterium decipiens]
MAEQRININHWASMHTAKKTLAPYVAFGEFEQSIVWGGGSIEQSLAKSDPAASAVRDAVHIYRTGYHTEHEVRAFLTANGHAANESDKAIDILNAPGLLIGDVALEERYSRNQLYYNLKGSDPVEVQRRISEASVAIIGCGGIGNYVAPGLAGSGVGRLVLADSDTIELSNLSRQFMFRESDIGRKKAEVMAESIAGINSSIAVSAISDFQASSTDSFNQFCDVDVIVLSADSPANIYTWCNRFSMRSGVPYIQVGYINDLPVLGPFVIPGKTGCWECSNPTASTGEEDRKSHYQQAPSHAWTVMVSSGLAVDDILAFLGGYADPVTLNKRIGLYKSELRFQTQPIVRCSHFAK